MIIYKRNYSLNSVVKNKYEGYNNLNHSLQSFLEGSSIRVNLISHHVDSK